MILVEDDEIGLCSEDVITAAADERFFRAGASILPGGGSGLRIFLRLHMRMRSGQTTRATRNIRV